MQLEDINPKTTYQLILVTVLYFVAYGWQRPWSEEFW